MIYNERNIRKEIMLEAAKQIMIAARTAPKGKGVDIIEIITLSHDSLPTLSENMRSEGKKRGMMFFLREYRASRRSYPHRNPPTPLRFELRILWSENVW